MGCAISSSDEAARSKRIDRTLAAERLSRKDEIKLLLLGEMVCSGVYMASYMNRLSYFHSILHSVDARLLDST